MAQRRANAKRPLGAIENPPVIDLTGDDDSPLRRPLKVPRLAERAPVSHVDHNVDESNDELADTLELSQDYASTQYLNWHLYGNCTTKTATCTAAHVDQVPFLPRLSE